MRIFKSSLLSGVLFLGLLSLTNPAMAQKQRVYAAEINNSNLLTDDFVHSFTGNKLSNFTLYHPAILNQLSKMIPPSKWDYFLEYSQREHYPLEFKNFSNFGISQLTMYLLCRFNFDNLDYFIIEVPAAENKHLAIGSRPETDIYFVATYIQIVDEKGMTNKQKNKESHYLKKDKLWTDLKARLKMQEGRMIDSTLFFKTTLPLPSRSTAYYDQKYQEALAVAANKVKAEEDAYRKKRDQVETEKQARIQKKKDEIANYTKQLLALNQPLLEAYQSGNFREVLTHYNYWTGLPIDIDDEMPKITGQLNEPPHYKYHQKSKFHFVKKLTTMDMICEVNLRCMITSQQYNTRQENFMYPQSFQITKDPNVFVNPDFAKDGVFSNKEFYQEPWNYFQKYFSENVNEAVASEFKIILADNIVTLAFKSKQFDKGRYYWPEEMYELIAKIKYANEIIGNIERE